jgi:hypothetical protein
VKLEPPKSIKVLTVQSPVFNLKRIKIFSPATNYALLTTSVHIDIASNPSQPYSTADILSGFNNTDQNSLKATATCQLNARWPANYGDVYFGNGCLYDSSGNKIFDQCCGPPDPNNSGLTTNPYCAPAPPSPSQVLFNKDGSSICSSIHSDSCKSGAQRFQDNTVYHQYTSSVWPDSGGFDFGGFGGIDGCTVIWACDNSDAYHQGMTGAQIKDA